MLLIYNILSFKKKKYVYFMPLLTLGLGNNIPATKIMLVGTKQDILKGKKTASPVSGWMVESTTLKKKKFSLKIFYREKK